MRSRSAILLLFCLSFALIPAVRSSATTAGLRVNEAATRVTLRESTAEVALAIENSFTESVRVRIELEWVDTKDHITNRTERVETVFPGANKIKTPLQLYNYFQDRETIWYRLKYRVTTEPASSQSFSPVTGIM